MLKNKCLRATFSQSLIATAREAPSDAQAISHRLLIRGGYIRQVASGLYSLLPLGYRTLRKIETIIDEEMANIGCSKLDLPLVLPKSIWDKTGRWTGLGEQLFRLKDRKGADLCLAPTHEEAITTLVKEVVDARYPLPLRLYQIGKKYRDEERPRMGLLRAREFVMKDLYSFDVTKEDALKTYEEVAEAYRRIFTRLGIPFVQAEADSGDIGGDNSHEFHIISDVGQDRILVCKCGYCANVERALGKPVIKTSFTEVDSKVLQQLQFITKELLKFDMKEEDLEQLSKICDIDYSFYSSVNKKPDVIALVPKGRGVNNFSKKKFLDQKAIKDSSVKLIVDESLAKLWPNHTKYGDKIVGVSNIATLEEGDHCDKCDGKFSESKGIEVGHIFYLGTKYSVPLKANYKNKPIEMGCYGIGVSRILSAAIEHPNCHDDKGIIWPESIAPYRVNIVPLGEPGSVPYQLAKSLHDHLDGKQLMTNWPAAPSTKNDVLLDDRQASAGVKLFDSELIGFPWTVVVGKTAAQGQVEIQKRSKGSSVKKVVTPEELIKMIQ